MVSSPVVVVAALAVRSRSLPVVVMTDVSEIEARVGVIAPFPVTWKSALAAHINKVNTQAKKDGKPDRFLARITGPDTARVWRLS